MPALFHISLPGSSHLFLSSPSDGSMSAKAAQAIAKLGNNHDICVVRGGFKAWEVGGTSATNLINLKAFHYLDLILAFLSGSSGRGPSYRSTQE